MESGAVLGAGLPYDTLLSLDWMELDRERHRLAFGGEVYPLDCGKIARTDWDLNSGKWTQRRLRGHNPLSPDHRWLTDLHDGGLDLWDISTGEKRGRLHRVGDVPAKEWEGWEPVSGGGLRQTRIPGVELHFSKDSRFLFVTGLRTVTPVTILFDTRPTFKNPLGASRSQTVGRLWELHTQHEVCTLIDCEEAFLSADGQTLVTRAHANRIKVWDMPPRKPWWAAPAVGGALWALALIAGLDFHERPNRSLVAMLNRLPAPVAAETRPPTASSKKITGSAPTLRRRG
jgi:hypothetical protein